MRALTPIRESIEALKESPEPYDVFLCPAWDDRRGAVKELHDTLEAVDVSVWFSEKSVALGTPLLCEIDKGLAKSWAGLALVIPAFLHRLDAAGTAEKELSALLAREFLVPIVHDTTFNDLREVSPLLASRRRLSIEENAMGEIATKISDLVSIDAY